MPDTPPREKTQLATAPSRREIVISRVRIGAWLLVLLGGFLIAIPECKEMYEEFEVNLPTSTELAIFVSNFVIRFSVVFVPVVVLTVIALEQGLLSVPRESTRRTLGILNWFFLIVVLIALVVIVSWPSIGIVQGLSG